MRTIGFHGGSSLCELGTVSDVVLFFDCLSMYVESARPEQDWSLLSDRLYRRYLREDELDAALRLMEQAKQIFSTHPAATAVNWDPALLGDRQRTWLDPTRPTLADVFAKYFECFSHCVESSKIFMSSWNMYKPVRTVIADLPDFAVEKKRSLEEYDSLEGEPLWRR
ncbi:hypothetical protein [Ralstonia pseudosolanacearum]|uniref:Uncharacterized protein n=1 Tax=Ralstonia solanacearum TaxID=305 RepID=A0AA92IE74_RALSL|nr:hypothetical protein [Ralstonia pseudosolanacearum]QCX49533.1 hypothetical protein E7Z57_10710 [Ralstonia pseudosolanacearum]